MRVRVWAVWTALALALVWISPQTVRGQVAGIPTDAEQAAVEPSLVELLDRGRALESELRWGEAFTLYEDGLRQYPSEPSIAERLSVTRMHYDLGRRYADPRFRETVSSIPRREALDLYSEVLLKLQSYYVDAPNWSKIHESGVAGFEVALSDAEFVERNLADVPQARIDRFRRRLRERVPSRQVDSRQSAREAAGTAARLAASELGLSETAAIVEYVCGATNSLDLYSAFLTPGQLDEVYAQIDGNFVGLGIELKADDGALLLLDVITGSPADRAGLKAGDRITAVDGRSTSEYSTDEAANLLQGEEGTIVEVEVVSPGEPARSLRIRREEVEVPSVDNVRLVDRNLGIGYLRLTCFQKTTSADLDAALWKLHRDGMKSLIIDLRGNPGGLLTAAVDVVDKFVKSGIIVSTRGRSPHEDYTYTAHAAGTWDLPLVVLIDEDSASASEIFAGAIRDHRRGSLVGRRTYGKGSVQGIFPLNHADSGLRLTTAKFYSPKGLAFNHVGVEPDILVQLVARPVFGEDGETEMVEPATDADLEAAIREAQTQLASRETAADR